MVIVISAGTLVDTELTAVTANVYLTPPVSPFTEHTVDTVLTRATNSTPVLFLNTEQTYSFTEEEYVD